jgi:hypothetical protein
LRFRCILKRPFGTKTSDLDLKLWFLHRVTLPGELCCLLITLVCLSFFSLRSQNQRFRGIYFLYAHIKKCWCIMLSTLSVSLSICFRSVYPLSSQLLNFRGILMKTDTKKDHNVLICILEEKGFPQFLKELWLVYYKVLYLCS